MSAVNGLKLLTICLALFLVLPGFQTMQTQHDDHHELSEGQGKTLVKLARKTLMERFHREVNETETLQLDRELSEEAFKACRGTFVTLTKQGRLRGCIGSLSATEPLTENIRHNAVNAAFHDPRFPALAAEELDQIDIEISILTEPAPLQYTDADELVSLLRPEIDGVIIRKGVASATFLPQVWKQLPRPDVFLSHLCTKAGLPAGAWRAGDLEVLTYQVQYFEEDK